MPTVDPERIARAKELRDSGMSWRAVHEETGLAMPTLFKYLGPKAGRNDPPPGGRKSNTRTKTRPTDEQLASMMTKVAVAPAIPMGLWVKCDFCATHFVKTGPGAAQRLVELSANEPALRNVMEWLWRFGEEVAWATVLATWLGIPIAHHLAPPFVYRWIQAPLGLPDRGPSAEPPHAHATDVPANPFADMDMDTLMRMAQGFGINVEPPMNGHFDATTAEATAEAAATDAATDALATVAADSVPE
jgi:hypothetical protein